MLIAITIVIMAAVAYAYAREGLLTAFTMFVNIFLAGVLTFNFWEPIADLLDPILNDTPFTGYEDSFVMVVLFCGICGLLRLATNTLAPREVDFPAGLLRGGAVFFGLAAGYLVSGILTCILQTIPWHENFMSFDYRVESGQGFRKILPPDRLWLAMMHRASGEKGPLARGEDYPAFDRDGNYELRYGRYRRYNESGKTHDYWGETKVKTDDES
jgi:hypothetical protein